MSFAKLSDIGRTERMLEGVKRQDVVCVVIEAESGRVVVDLLTDCGLGRAGATFSVRQAAARPGRPDVGSLLSGTAKSPAGRLLPGSGAGEVVAFEGAAVIGRELFVEDVAFRVHDGMEFEVQVLRGFVRPTRVSTGKQGYTQYLDVVDPHFALRTASVEKAADLLERATARAWPGGKACLLTVDGDGRYGKIVDLRGKGALAAMEEAVDAGEFDRGSPSHVVPAWTLPLGLDHAWRELDPRQEHSAVHGRISRQYVKGRHTQFRDSFVVVTTEETWSFGAPTGKYRKVAAGLLPLPEFGAKALVDVGLAPLVGAKAKPIRFFYDGPDKVAAAVTARAMRRPETTNDPIARTGPAFRKAARPEERDDGPPERDEGAKPVARFAFR